MKTVMIVEGWSFTRSEKRVLLTVLGTIAIVSIMVLVELLAKPPLLEVSWIQTSTGITCYTLADQPYFSSCGVGMGSYISPTPAWVSLP